MTTSLLKSSRSFTVSEGVDVGRIAGRVADGMFVPALQPRAEAQPKHISLDGVAG